MATGSNRRLIWNTREEVLSSDLNRVQDFVARDTAEIMRALLAKSDRLGYFASANTFSAAATEDHTATEAPLYGQVLSGLLCHPIDNTLNITIDAGSAMVVDPDAMPDLDDSVYKLINDPGGSVTLTTNTSGSTRFDVVECSRSDVVTESDSRNQYDTSTGLFSPTTFDKVALGQFTYRVRAGTPGAGVPAGASGWLPLLVVQIPTGVTTQLNTCTFWDVRPLVSQRYFGLANKPRHFDHFQRCVGSAHTFSGNIVFEGQAEVCDSWGNRLGGMLQAPDSSGNVQYIVNLMDSANQESGFVAGTNSFFFVYLATPITTDTNGTNLPLLGPRWARYARSAGGALQPMEPAGIPIVSSKAPDENGRAALSPPGYASTANCSLQGYCIAVGWVAGANAMQPFLAQGRRFTFAGTQPVIPGGTSTANVCTWNLDPDTVFPRMASSMHVTFSTLLTAIAGAYQTEMNVLVSLQAGGGNTLADLKTQGITPSQLQRMTWSADIPLEALPLTLDATRTITTQQTNPNATVSNTTATVVRVDF